MRKHIINIAEVELQPRPPQYAPTGRAAERYEARIGMIAPKIGAKKLGYNLTAVPPGKRAFPFHSHRVQEEMFYVVEGTGEVRIGTERFPIRAGDVIACPTGGPETAHQIANTGKTELRYLAVSTKEPTEICEYPDTGKIAGFGESLRFVVRGDQQVGYWEDE
ncbi:MAG: cupin domain-containing protein [Betaproteobacteria bacterium]|nr:MAG: cupin domain-containing protein [Betaproteobacteria bacterium]